MAGRNGNMERIRADLLRRARTERQRDGLGGREDGTQQETANPPNQALEEGVNDQSSPAQGVLSRWAALPRSQITTRTQRISSQERQSFKASASSPSRPATVFSSIYGEPGAPSSLPSPIPRPQIPDMPSSPPPVAAPSAYPQPRDHSTDLGPHASNPLPWPTNCWGSERHSYQLSSLTEEAASDVQSGRKARPKRFLFCFPWVRSQLIRSQILTCFISGVFALGLLAVYIGLAFTNHISSREVTIMIVIVIASATIFFCLSIIRLCLLVARCHGSPDRRVSEMLRPRGYAVPPRAIHVVLARDEEARGVESETAKCQPPAYGLWRGSVKVDPNRLFWQRTESASPVAAYTGGTRRPPSYASDDGISYVVEARPRSLAPSSHT